MKSTRGWLGKARLLLGAMGALGLVVLGSVHQASAGLVNVCTETNLLAQIRAGGTVTFGCAGAIELSAPIRITNTVILDATSGEIVLRPDGSTRIFVVETNGSLTLSNLVLSGGRDGSDGGAAILNRGTVLLVSCLLSNNVATGASGSPGRDSSDGGTNGGDGHNGGSGRRIAGGAVFNLGRFTAVETGFFGNRAVGGGAGSGGNAHGGEILGGDGGDGGNGGAAVGGAIYNGGRGRIELYACGFDGNSVQGGDGAEGGELGDGAYPGVAGRGGRGGLAAGGAIYSTNKTQVVIRGCTFSFNTVLSGDSAVGGTSNDSGKPGRDGPGAFGGGVCNYGQATVVNSTFFENAIQAGNGGDGDNAALKAGNGGNGGSAWGGSWFNAGSSFITNCTFSGGFARPGTNGLAGTGRYSGRNGDRGSTRGANIGSTQGKFFLSHTILDNPASSSAFVTNIVITLTTNITENLSGTTNADRVVCTRVIHTRVDGSVIRNVLTCETNEITGTNLVAAVTTSATTNTVQTAVTDNRSNAYGGIKDGGYNLLSDHSIKFKRNSSSKVDIDAELGPLDDNGGPTETMELLNTSPAIDAGSPTSRLRTDQRGALRPSGDAVDIGAYEFEGEIYEPPSISTQPVDNTVDGGSAASFLVVAEGSDPISYQWYRAGLAVSNAVGALLTIPHALPGDAGGYYVVVTNVMGMVTSRVATLTVRAAAPAITNDLADVTLYRGENTAFTLQLGGIPAPFVQWFFNTTNLVAGVSGPTLVLTNVQPAQAGTYQAVATNLFGNVTSRVAMLTVTESMPIIVSEPADYSGYSGVALTLTFPTLGGPVPVTQWQFNGTNLVGATGATLRLTNAQPSHSGTYQAVATNEFGSVTSRVATVSIVDSAPLVLQAPPASTNLAAGTTLVLAVVVEGSLPMTLQWYFTNQSSVTTPVSGGTNSTLTLPNFQAANEGLYTLELNNPFDTVFTDSFQAQLQLAAPALR